MIIRQNLPIIVNVRLTRVYVLWTVVAIVSNTVLVPVNLTFSPDRKHFYLRVFLLRVTQSVTIVIIIALQESHTVFNNLTRASEIYNFVLTLHTF